MPTSLISGSAHKKLELLKTPRGQGTFEKLCHEHPAAQRSRLWPYIFGHHADFIGESPVKYHITKVAIDANDENESEGFTVTHLTIQWVEMEEEAGPFGTHQKTY